MSEPRTRAGQALIDAGFFLAHPFTIRHPLVTPDLMAGRDRLRDAIVAIEAEAFGEIPDDAPALREAAWEKPQ